MEAAWESGFPGATLRQCLKEAVTLSSDFPLHHRQICQISVLTSLLKINQEGRAGPGKGGCWARTARGQDPG